MNPDEPNPQPRNLLNPYFNVSFLHTPSHKLYFLIASFPTDILTSGPNFHDVITAMVPAHQNTPDQEGSVRMFWTLITDPAA